MSNFHLLGLFSFNTGRIKTKSGAESELYSLIVLSNPNIHLLLIDSVKNRVRLSAMKSKLTEKVRFSRENSRKRNEN